MLTTTKYECSHCDIGTHDGYGYGKSATVKHERVCKKAKRLRIGDHSVVYIKNSRDYLDFFNVPKKSLEGERFPSWFDERGSEESTSWAIDRCLTEISNHKTSIAECEKRLQELRSTCDER